MRDRLHNHMSQEISDYQIWILNNTRDRSVDAMQCAAYVLQSVMNRTFVTDNKALSGTWMEVSPCERLSLEDLSLHLDGGEIQFGTRLHTGPIASSPQLLLCGQGPVKYEFSPQSSNQGLIHLQLWRSLNNSPPSAWRSHASLASIQS